MNPFRFLTIMILSIMMAALIGPSGHSDAAADKAGQAFAPHSAHIGGSALDVVVRGHYAYVGYAGELAVLDIADVSSPQRVGYVMLSANDLALYGGYVLVAGEDGLHTVDVRTPDAPRVAGHLPMPQTAVGVAVHDRVAYVVTSSSGLHVIDVRNPNRPHQLAFLPVREHLPDVEVAGSYAYIAANRGLYVVDVSNPRGPRITASLELPGFAADLTFSGDRLYMTNEFEGLCIVDLSDPARPTLVRSVPLNTMVWDVVVEGDVGYVAATEPGLHVVTDIHGPRPVPAHGLWEPSSLWALAAAGGRLFGVNMDGDLHIFDLADAANPTLAGSYDAPGYTTRVAAHRAYAYAVADGQGAVYELHGDLSHGLDAVKVDIAPDRTVAIEATSNGFIASGETTALWAGVRGEDSELRSAVVFPAPRSLHNVVAAENRFYGIGNDGSLLWVEDPGVKPLQHGVLTLEDGGALSLDAAGDQVYLGTQSGLSVLAHASGRAPRQTLFVDTAGAVDIVRTDGSRGFVVVNSRQLCALGLDDRLNPSLAGCVDLTSVAVDAALYDDRAIVALGPAGVTIVDLSNPAQPAIAGSIEIEGTALDVAASEGTAYVANAAGGVLAVGL